MAHEIDFRTVPARTLAAFRFHVTTAELTQMGEKMGGAFGRVAAALGAAGVAVAGPAVACYTRTDDGLDVAAGFPTSAPIASGDGVASVTLPSAEVAHTTHIGSYEELPKAYDALRTGAQAQGRELDDEGQMWEEYLTGPDVPPERMRTEIYWPLRAGSA